MSKITFKRLLLLAVLVLVVGCPKETVHQVSTPLVIHKPAKLVLAYPVYALSGLYADSLPLQQFIRHMVDTHDFNEHYLNHLFSQAQRLPYVIRLENAPLQAVTKPIKPKPGSWSRYRKKFLNEQHIESGLRFWVEYTGAIDQASKRYHVDPEYLVAIIGVETFFGRNMGNTRIFDALTTLAFATERRAPFFRGELEQFLLLTREEHYHPFELLGSWAGAMGLGQFMPSNFRQLAIDFNQDGRRDLWYPEDAIASVAHYFFRQGWQFRQPVAEQLLDANDPAAITLSHYQGDEYWRIYPNFKVIRHYNNSNKYVMVVHQLAQAIKQRYAQNAMSMKQTAAVSLANE